MNLTEAILTLNTLGYNVLFCSKQETEDRDGYGILINGADKEMFDSESDLIRYAQQLEEGKDDE